MSGGKGTSRNKKKPKVQEKEEKESTEPEPAAAATRRAVVKMVIKVYISGMSGSKEVGESFPGRRGEKQTPKRNELQLSSSFAY